MNAKTKKRALFAPMILIMIIALFAGATSGLICGAKSSAHKAYAENAVNSEESSAILPASPLEYLALTEPRGACYFGGNYAVIEGKTVRIFYENGEEITLTGFVSLGQIKFYNEHSVLVSDNGSIYFIDLNDATRRKKMVTGGTFFDFNDEYLITVFSQILFVFRISDALNYATDQAAELKSLAELGNANGERPIAINDKNEVFYLSGRTDIRLNIYDIAEKTTGELVKNITDITPSIMAANGDEIYFISAGNLYSLSVKEGATPVKLVIPETPYELGNVRAAEGLSFKNGNLLITDKNQQAIMEFTVKEATLEYTGFAIASGRSAYNRIGKNVSSVARYGNFVAALDDFKLTVIKTGANSENLDTYDRNSFINLFVGNAPSLFALGANTLTAVSGNKITGYKTTEAEGVSGNSNDFTEAAEILGIEHNVKAITYQSGFYYVLAADDGASSNNAYVYKICEENFSVEGEPVIFYGQSGADKIAADVYGNVYIADGANIYKNSYVNSFPSLGAQSLFTDLAGVLYGVKEGKIYYHKPEEGAAGEWVLAEDFGRNDIKAAAAYFDKTEVFFVTESGEYLYRTESLKNVAVNSAVIPAEFLNRTALSYDKSVSQGKDKLRYCKIAESKTAVSGFGYNVNAYYADYASGEGSSFGFSGLAPLEREYIAVGEIKIGSAIGEELKLLVLAAQNGVVLIDSVQTETLVKSTTAAPEKAYTSTNVNLYHLPIITEKDTFTATLAEKSLRLNKATEIYPKFKTSFLEKEYYFATVKVDGTEYAGYIPSDFTVETLYENPVKDEYTIKITSAVTVYGDENLQNAVSELADGTKIRYYGAKDGVAKIAYETEEGYKIGYIAEKKIKDEAGTAVRNILIILAVVASVCGTTTYFILRKKRS